MILGVVLAHDAIVAASPSERLAGDPRALGRGSEGGLYSMGVKSPFKMRVRLSLRAIAPPRPWKGCQGCLGVYDRVDHALSHGRVDRVGRVVAGESVRESLRC